MKIKNKQSECVSLFQLFVEKIAEKLRTKAKPFFLSLVLGVLLSVARRRTVTQWIKAAKLSDDFRQIFCIHSTNGVFRNFSWHPIGILSVVPSRIHQQSRSRSCRKKHVRRDTTRIFSVGQPRWFSRKVFLLHKLRKS